MPIPTYMSPNITALIKKATKARETGKDAFADYLLELRKLDAHKTAGYKTERPFYNAQFGIADRALSDWTHAGRIRAALTTEGVNLNTVEDAGVTAYAGASASQAKEVKNLLHTGKTLKNALLTVAGEDLAAFQNPEKAFNAVLGDNLPPAFEALQLSIATLAFSTPIKTLREGQAVLMECYEALAILLEATEKGISLKDGLDKAFPESN